VPLDLDEPKRPIQRHARQCRHEVKHLEALGARGEPARPEDGVPKAPNQGARSQAMSETSARASIYMFSVSSVLVALGFVSQVADGVGVAFEVFALSVLPLVYFLWCGTYVRLVECGAEDLRYGMAINRIQGYYKELADDRADLFLLSGHDDAAGVFLNMGIALDRRSPAFAFSTAIAVVNGVVGGAVPALALGAIPDLPS
jgi:hypothetical protein